MQLDPVKLQVFSDHTMAVVEAMANTLYRTAYSTFVKETEDFTTGLVTPEGLTYASPKSLGANWFMGLDYSQALAMIDSYEEGDICITNDPYSGSVCTHTPDLHIWKPIFYQGKLISFAVGHIHNTDMGGAVPASISRTLTEVQQEGIRIRPVKLMRRGILNQEVLELILDNVRMRDQNWGDLKAMIASMNTGEAKLLDVAARFGLNDFLVGLVDLLDYCELQTRALIRTIPNGAYTFQDYLDEDSLDGTPCRLACTMEVKDENIVLDFRNSDPQVHSAFNVPTGGNPRHTLLMVPIYYAFHTLKPEIEINTGMTRPFHCLLAEGSILYPQFPAAIGLRTLTCARLQDVVFGCMSQALPDLLPAAPAGSISILNVRTTNPETGKIVMAALAPVVGGGGGMPFGDGLSGAGGNAGSLKNTPVEINEVEVPIQVTKYHLTPDSGGAGRYRGGLAMTFECKVFSPNTVMTARNRDRTRFRAWGIKGGKAGKPSTFMVNAGVPGEVVLGNKDVFTAEPGDLILLTSSGAGGLGSPYDRPVDDVFADVEQGFVTETGARQDYGVVITDGSVDSAATEALRSKLRAMQGNTHFDYGPEREAFEQAWPAQHYDALVTALQEVPVEWRFFLKRRIMKKYGETGLSSVAAVIDAVKTERQQFRGLQ
jgi:N-methylhydantoinase B